MFGHGRMHGAGFRHRGRWGAGGFGMMDMEGGFRGRGGRRRKAFEGSQLRLILLRLIEDEPRHGYDLIRAIEELSSGAYAPSPGVVYPTITLLGDMGLIAEQSSDGAKKLYAVTGDGTAHLSENADEVAALFQRLEAMGEEHARTDRHSVRRAMGNLRQVLLHKLTDPDANEDTINAIVSTIDEAAQKIERLK